MTYSDTLAFDPPETPSGKPFGMPAHEFHRHVRRMRDVRDAMKATSGVTRLRVWLSEEAEVRGACRLADRRDHHDLDQTLIDCGLVLDAAPRVPGVTDGGDLATHAVDLRFSEYDGDERAERWRREAHATGDVAHDRDDQLADAQTYRATVVQEDGGGRR
jgi:hypothetical protein